MNLSKKFTYPFLETIKIKEGKIYNLSNHNHRLNKTRKEIYDSKDYIELRDHIKIPSELYNNLIKCRILYQQNIISVDFEKYNIPKINSLKIINCDDIDYRYKSSNRECLKQLYEHRGNCDDILIIKNNNVTDSYFANLILFDGEKWITPKVPLLNGTQRKLLIDKNKIIVKKVSINDIRNYKKIGLVNAMLNIEDMPIIPIENVLM